MRLAPVKAAALAVLFVLSFGTAAAKAESLVFTIFKEDDPIGRDVYSIDKNGDLTTVKVEMQTDVKLLFLDFHYRQDRTEVWRGDRLESLVSQTNDDGTKRYVELRRDGDSLVGTVDGTKKTLPGSIVPFTLWSPAFLKASTLLDVSDTSQMKIGVQDKGVDQLTVNGKSIAAHHYHLTGDLNWDFWYDADGLLLKTTFRRSGYPIAFIRQ